MEDYRKGAHTVFDIKYHLVWITKYRYKVLNGELGLRVRDIIREACGEMDVIILSGVVSTDHVHLFVSASPKISVSNIVQKLKGKSSHKIQREFPHLKKRYWGQHIWARGYFCASSGNITDEMITEYLENHGSPPKKDNFVVENEPS